MVYPVEMLTLHIGKSDPYVVFSLSGQKVHKSQTKKKTLTPEWDEDFTCIVVRPSENDNLYPHLIPFVAFTRCRRVHCRGIRLE